MIQLPAGRARRLAWSCAAAAVLVVVTYLVAVRTGAGQILDDWAFEGRKAVNLSVRRNVTELLSVVAIVVVVVLGAVECAVAVRRDHWRSAVGTVVAVAGAVLSANWLKDTMSRPHLTDTVSSPLNTYPSGHMAAIMAVALAALLVSPPARRAAVSYVVGPIAAVVGIAVLGSSWHRPSDVVGAVALAGVWCTAVALLLGADLDAHEAPAGPDAAVAHPGPGVPTARRVVAITLVLAVAVTLSFRLPANPQHRLWAYLVAIVGVVAAVFLALWVFAWALAGSAARLPSTRERAP
jgi:hypothetical protein